MRYGIKVDYYTHRPSGKKIMSMSDFIKKTNLLHNRIQIIVALAEKQKTYKELYNVI